MKWIAGLEIAGAIMIIAAIIKAVIQNHKNNRKEKNARYEAETIRRKEKDD